MFEQIKTGELSPKEFLFGFYYAQSKYLSDLLRDNDSSYNCDLVSPYHLTVYHSTDLVDFKFDIQYDDLSKEVYVIPEYKIKRSTEDKELRRRLTDWTDDAINIHIKHWDKAFSEIREFSDTLENITDFLYPITCTNSSNKIENIRLNLLFDAVTDVFSVQSVSKTLVKIDCNADLFHSIMQTPDGLKHTFISKDNGLLVRHQGGEKKWERLKVDERKLFNNVFNISKDEGEDYSIFSIDSYVLNGETCSSESHLFRGETLKKSLYSDDISMSVDRLSQILDFTQLADNDIVLVYNLFCNASVFVFDEAVSYVRILKEGSMERYEIKQHTPIEMFRKISARSSDENIQKFISLVDGIDLKSIYDGNVFVPMRPNNDIEQPEGSADEVQDGSLDEVPDGKAELKPNLQDGKFAEIEKNNIDKIRIKINGELSPEEFQLCWAKTMQFVINNITDREKLVLKYFIEILSPTHIVWYEYHSRMEKDKYDHDVEVFLHEDRIIAEYDIDNGRIDTSLEVYPSRDFDARKIKDLATEGYENIIKMFIIHAKTFDSVKKSGKYENKENDIYRLRYPFGFNPVTCFFHNSHKLVNVRLSPFFEAEYCHDPKTSEVCERIICYDEESEINYIRVTDKDGWCTFSLNKDSFTLKEADSHENYRYLSDKMKNILQKAIKVRANGQDSWMCFSLKFFYLNGTSVNSNLHLFDEKYVTAVQNHVRKPSTIRELELSHLLDLGSGSKDILMYHEILTTHVFVISGNTLLHNTYNAFKKLKTSTQYDILEVLDKEELKERYPSPDSQNLRGFMPLFNKLRRDDVWSVYDGTKFLAVRNPNK